MDFEYQKLECTVTKRFRKQSEQSISAIPILKLKIE